MAVKKYMCRTWIRGCSRCTGKVLSASLSLVFPAHCLDSVLLGRKKARRLKEEKVKMKLKLAIVRSVIMLNSVIIIQAAQETVLQGLEDIWG